MKKKKGEREEEKYRNEIKKNKKKNGEMNKTD